VKKSEDDSVSYAQARDALGEGYLCKGEKRRGRKRGKRTEGPGGEIRGGENRKQGLCFRMTSVSCHKIARDEEEKRGVE